MSMIKVENLTFTYPTSYDPVFEKVDFQMDTDWKLGLVGRNGRGKTTLLDLLLGKYEYSGKILHSVEFDYYPYQVAAPEKITEDILQTICPQAEAWELMRELSCLDVDMDVLRRPFQALSDGERAKVLLAALFLNEERFLLIDEPTNHLDARAREVVSAYLCRKKGFIVVSHDRRFLDGCVDHILSLNRTDITVQNGNFSSWMENFERQQNFEAAQNERLKKDIGRLQQAARRSSGWSDAVEKSKKGTKQAGLKIDRGYVGHKAAKMMKRAKTLEARQRQAMEQKSLLLKNTETAEDLKIHPLEYHAERLVSFSNVAVLYDNAPICAPVSFAVHRGDRIFLDGKNGSGKSSLLKLLSNCPPACRGTVTIGSGLVVSYVPQTTAHLSGTLSELAERCGLEEHLLKAILRKMDFERVQFEKDMRDFSEGQKKKVLIAKSLCEQAHLYVWDEPLNFIDVYSRIQIERLLAQCAPTMLLVEHDVAFREAIATKVVTL